MYDTIPIELPTGGLDFNNPKSVEETLVAMSQTLLKQNEEHPRNVGLWLKSELVGFCAALADSKRQGLSIGHTLAATTETFSTLLALMVGAATPPNSGQAEELVMGIVQHFVTHMAAVIQANEKHKVGRQEKPTYGFLH